MSELADLAALASLEPEPTVTVTLTVAQIDALVSLAELGIDEKQYDIDENHPYTEEEEADALAECDLAAAAIDSITEQRGQAA